MKIINTCPGCRGECRRAWPSLMAPFMAERTLKAPPPLARLLECDYCGLRFSNLRLDEDEVAHLYRDYRGEDYFRCRHRHEPWYSRRMNGNLGGAPKEILGRQKYLEKLLRERGTWSLIQTVLDYGGDQGQFIPAELKAQKFVFEISGVEPVAGVERIREAAQLEGKQFHLVMVCHVLEHVMDLSAFLRHVAQYVAPGGTLYIEVPLERPLIHSHPPGLLMKWHRWLTHHLRCFQIVDFVSTAARATLGWIPPFGLLKISEHVNFFDGRSLEMLLASENFNDITVIATPSKHRIGRIGVLRCLATQPAIRISPEAL